MVKDDLTSKILAVWFKTLLTGNAFFILLLLIAALVDGLPFISADSLEWVIIVMVLIFSFLLSLPILALFAGIVWLIERHRNESTHLTDVLLAFAFLNLLIGVSWALFAGDEGLILLVFMGVFSACGFFYLYRALRPKPRQANGHNSSY